MSRNLILGLAAALAAALIGTGWQLASRHGVTTTLGPAELAVLRYCIPALLLAPLLRGVGLLPRTMPRWTLLQLVVGGGLPFGLVVLAGARFAPAAHMGVVMSGMLPLFTALAAWLVTGDRLGPLRIAGLALIGAGVCTLGWSGLDAASWRGDLLFLAAAALWAMHTLAFRRSGLGPWQGAALVNMWSALALLALLPWLGAPRLLTAPWHDIAFQALWQGVLAGVLGLVAYMAAVTRLGPPRGTFSGIGAADDGGGAAVLLAEPLTTPTLLAVVLVAAGILLAAWQAPRAPVD